MYKRQSHNIQQTAAATAAFSLLPVECNLYLVAYSSGLLTVDQTRVEIRMIRDQITPTFVLFFYFMVVSTAS